LEGAGASERGGSLLRAGANSSRVRGMPRFVIGILLAALAFPLMAAEKVFDFSELKAGETPAGFRSAVSGEGKPGEWKIMMDELPSAMPPIFAVSTSANTRPVLAQVSRDKTDEHSPLLIYEGEVFGDFKITTRFKLVDGEAEQMAGIAFRIQDEKNYYYIRASGLGNSFYFFKIVDGLRSLPIGVKTGIPKGKWQEMTIECNGSEIRASLNGKEVIPPLGDKSFSSGKIGFWTKSDSVSYFTDTRINYHPREKLAQALVRETISKNPRLRGLQIIAKPKPDTAAQIIGSDDASLIGQAASADALDSMRSGQIYHSKKGGNVTITMPLRDNNGDRVAAVKVIMKSFPGQTENNAAARAVPIVKSMEGRIHKATDLLE
jgi:hypothetical protein